MKRGDAVGRPSGRSSLVGHPSAKFFEEKGRELRKREKPRLLGCRRGLYALWIDERTWPARGGGGRSRAHSAGSRRPCQGASQIVLRVAMLAREIWASQAEDRCHLSGRDVQGEQFSRQPQIDDAPVHMGKAFQNMPTLHPASIDTRGSWLRCKPGSIPGSGAAVDCSAIACRAERSKSWAALARMGRASTTLTQGADPKAVQRSSF